MQKTKLGTFSVFFDNQEEYHVLKNEIFTEDLYYFESDKIDPVILDIGANIGLATLYFKKHYPHAKITAVEPVAKNFKLLEQNIFENNLSNTYALELAVTAKPGVLTLYTDSNNNWHSTAGIIEGNWTKSQITTPVEVKAVTLSSLINQPIDLLKIDIEGAEQVALKETAPKLNLVKQILCEFHPVPGQNLAELVKHLEQTGFKIELYKKGKLTPLKRATGMVLINAYQENKR